MVVAVATVDVLVAVAAWAPAGTAIAVTAAVATAVMVMRRVQVPLGVMVWGSSRVHGATGVVGMLIGGDGLRGTSGLLDGS
ncbi:hypothetical protein GCM10010251_87780 [Streptomyces aurantiogriseus]|uniref:Uncharacterized protein n=1 Tax=Streptomyces aurantiogriseus TaxID=66870 RepID=A0A918FMX9_9ACTN|nr:hypothetical protein GCM10010251_87780 [Streptomyces aurantiogriseus]